MIDLANHSDKVYNLSKNAQEFYFENRTIEQMVEGLADSIEYAIKKHMKFYII